MVATTCVSIGFSLTWLIVLDFANSNGFFAMLASLVPIAGSGNKKQRMDDLPRCIS